MHKAVNKSKILLNKPIYDTIVDVLVYEVIFIVIFRLLLVFIPHREHEFIYYLNINLFYISSCFIFISISLSHVNRIILYLFGIWMSFSCLYSMFFIFTNPTTNEIWILFSINYHILSIVSTSLQFLISFFIFLYSIFPHKSKQYLLLRSIIAMILTSIFIYTPYMLNIDLYDFERLFGHNYYIHILNFSLLLVFWSQYTQNKVIFSEYLSNILTIFTILIGTEIFQFFSIKNELAFHYIAQYFHGILFSIIFILLFFRLVYLRNPNSKKNEEYIENY